MRHYKQLTYCQRCQIEILKKSGLSQANIAKLIGVSQSTVSRELSRNSSERGYRHKHAQAKAEKRREEAYKAVKMTETIKALIRNRLEDDWSPEQVSAWLLVEFELQISHEVIYQFIWSDKALGGGLFRHLRGRIRARRKRGAAKDSRGQIKNRVSIDERPAEVDAKSRIGDWEVDTVIGKGQQGAIVTLVERVTKTTLAAKVESRSAEEVTEAMIMLLAPYAKVLHSITADNGKEFAYHEKITEVFGVPFYFAHPYCSWERGLNENTNGLLRQYFPKKMDFRKVTQDDVDEAVAKLNSRPRKRLGFKTPDAIMKAHLEAA